MVKSPACLSVLFAVCACLIVPSLSSAQQADEGIKLYQAKKYQDAEKNLKEALNQSPDNHEARYYLGLTLIGLQQYGEARTELERVKTAVAGLDAAARESAPREDEIEVALGRAAIGARQYAEAWKSLDSAKEKNPKNPEVFLYRGMLDVEQKKYQDSLKELEQAIQLDPNAPYPHYYVGIAYANTGRPDKMVEQFQTFLKLAPDAPEAAKVRSMLKNIR